MNERSCITIEVDRLFRIESHILTGIYFENKVLQSTQTDNTGNIICFFLRQTIQFSEFLRSFFCSRYHLFHQVIGINDCSFTRFHLTFRQFYHTIREMYKAFTPFKTEFIQQNRKYLEVIILFVTNDINHFINRIISETKFGRANILRHINRGSIATKKQLMIQPLGSQVNPDRAVFFFEEKAFFQSLHYFLFSFKISIGFIIYLIEADPHLPVSLIKSGIHPVVHHLPQGTYFRITGFPFHQHFAGFLHQRRSSFRFLFRHAFFHQFGKFRFIMLVERHIVVAYQMITFLAGAFRSFAVSVFLPCQHGFADMDTTVVYYIRLYYSVSVCSHNVSQRISQKIVAHMT